MQEQTHRIAVIGGGIAGLAAAYTIQQEARAAGKPVSFVLIESTDRLGGKIATQQVDGFTIEGGPDCFIRQKPWAGELIGKLGLTGELIGTNDHQRKTYVLNRGKLTPLPDGVMLIVPTRVMPFVTTTLISWPGKIRMGMDLLIPKRKDESDESVGDFVRRRLGSEALEKIAEPLMSGIHVSDPEKQSLLATFPRFRNIEKKHRSLIKGMLAERRVHKNGHAPAPAQASKPSTPTTQFLTLRGGLGQMVEALEESLKDGQILRGVKASRIEALPEGGYSILLENDLRVEADAVVLATPAYVSAGLVRSFAPDIARSLDTIRYVSTATVSLAYRRGDIRKPFKGFGYVVPRKEKRQVSACTWTSMKFNHRAPEEHVLLRCFVGGPGHEELVDLDDAALLSLVRSELRDILKIDAEPVLTRIYRWHKANPQYDVNHIERVKEIKARLQVWPGLYLAGSAYDGVGVPDCIHQGQEAALSAVQSLTRLEPQPEPTAE